MIWPIPDSYSRKIPCYGEPGSFWEQRDDKRHCGIDIYAPKDSLILAVESGKVIETGIFTFQEIMPYWNTTYFLLIETKSGRVYNYAEMEATFKKVGDNVLTGEIIGRVGLVLNWKAIDSNSPSYIQFLLKTKNLSMLHLEIYKSPYIPLQNYLGGNYSGNEIPENLLDPADILLK